MPQSRAAIERGEFRRPLIFLGTDPATHCGKQVVPEDDPIGFSKLQVSHALDKGLDVDSDRTPLNAGSVFALDAAKGFRHGQSRVEARHDFGKVVDSVFRRLVRNRLARQLQPLLHREREGQSFRNYGFLERVGIRLM